MITAPLREAMRQPAFDVFALHPGDTARAVSHSRPGITYEMVVTPDGFVVHQQEGCEGEPFNGPLGCHHSKNLERYVTMTQALVKADAILTPAPIEFSPEQMKVITNTICKGATPTELELFVATCKRTGLDPFMRQIYAVKRYDSQANGLVMAIQVGIDGQRLIAERTGKYAGQDPIEWLDVEGSWTEVWTGKGDYPVAARCSVYRKDWTQKATAVCRWESYAQTYGKDHKMMPTWESMPDVMLGKCAESLALRRAFPAEMSAVAALAGQTYDPSLEVEEVATRDESKVIDGEWAERLDEDAPASPFKPAPEAPVGASDGTTSSNAEAQPRDAASTPPVREPVAPSDLLTAIAKKHGAATATKARAILPYLYGTGDLLKLSPDDRQDFAAKLRVWLGEPNHEHELAYAPDGRAVCARCGVEVEEANVTNEAAQGSLV